MAEAGRALLQHLKKYCTAAKKHGRLKLEENPNAPAWVREVLALVQESFFIDVEDNPYMHMLVVVHMKNILEGALAGDEQVVTFEGVIHLYLMLTLSDFYANQIGDFFRLCSAPSHAGVAALRL
jgi:hypothetical protein